MHLNGQHDELRSRINPAFNLLIGSGIVIGRTTAQGDYMRRHMKLAFAAGILLGLGATGVATAADMAIKARPVVAPVMYNWAGCYIGGNVGGGWARIDTTRVLDVTGAPAFANYGRENDSAFIGGGQAGCDFIAGSSLVFGVQGQFDFGDIKGRHAITDFPAFSETNSVKNIV